VDRQRPVDFGDDRLGRSGVPHLHDRFEGVSAGFQLGTFA
jgi:hypothetical protein